MHSFKDNKARAWEVIVDVTTIAHVRARVQINLLDAGEGKPADDPASAPLLPGRSPAPICSAQMEERKVTPEDFGRALRGDAIDEGCAALLNEIVDFFPQRRRMILRRMLDKGVEIQEKAAAAVMARLDSPDFGAWIDKML